jgi:hypothetical protein
MNLMLQLFMNSVKIRIQGVYNTPVRVVMWAYSGRMQYARTGCDVGLFRAYAIRPYSMQYAHAVKKINLDHIFEN